MVQDKPRQDGGMRKVQMENGLTRCSGGYCEMCPVRIQLECEMTPCDRIEHIRQCLRQMKPTMGFELAAVAEIEKELVALGEELSQQRTDATRYRWLRERDLSTLQVGGVFAGVTPENVVLNGEDLDIAIDTHRQAEMIAPTMSVDACG